MLFREHNLQTLQYLLVVSLKSCVEYSVTVNNNEAKDIIIMQKSLQWLSMESILTFVNKLYLGNKWLEINRQLFLCFPIFEQNNSTEQNKSIVRRLFVQLKF